MREGRIPELRSERTRSEATRRARRRSGRRRTRRRGGGGVGVRRSWSARSKIWRGVWSDDEEGEEALGVGGGHDGKEGGDGEEEEALAFSWAQKRQDAFFLPGDQIVFFLLNVFELLGLIFTFKPFLAVLEQQDTK
ncbi:hypothetical protein GUJ93_ZPchr0011g27239 [Zizania palustris]|uniref:Uncharacterized protein n=1 Tax=Zizania palustris TaxID=103762 RepID=A0A8J6BSC0_ZIZPA|nr:hypothetical protein GUJ93_ZPchr0011g27239 [Zizania palustris]